MNLKKKQVLLVSFMLFSLFFGAGNLIFPPFLGQNAGENTPLAIATFLITAVALPVLGVIVAARFDGLEKLSRKVNPVFAMLFTILIYLSIGPGLGIPRAASLPFEMAVAPYMPKDANLTVIMLVFSLVFFLIAGWLAMTPKKLVERIGKFLTPSLLCLLLFVFVNFLLRGTVDVVPAQESYQSNPLVKGFLEGYLTMDTIAALKEICNAIYGYDRDFCRNNFSSGIFDSCLHGNGILRCDSAPREWCMDITRYCSSAFWRYGSSCISRYFYSGMFDNLCRSDYFYFTVFFNFDKENIL